MAMTLVETITIGSGGAASATFSNIAQTGKDLLILVSGRRTDNGFRLYTRFNSDSGANYSYRRLDGNGSAVGSTTSTDDGVWATLVSPSTATASTFGNGAIYVSNYTSSVAKSVSVDGVSENNATLAYQEIVAGRWTGTNAITSVTIGENLAQHTTLSLYIIS